MMNRWTSLFRSLVLALLVILPIAALHAQDGHTTDDAIAFVAALPEVRQGLESSEGWTAQAYNTMNAYGVWRVQFWRADGETLATADINLDSGRVYTLEAYFYPSESVLQSAHDTIVEFVRSQPEVQELLDNPWDYAMYLDYNPWAYDGVWSVWIDNGEDPLYVWVRADKSSTFSTSNLELIRLGFGDLMSWEDWRNANTSSATAIAFAQGEIAAQLRDLPGWRTHAEPINGGTDGVWWVGFFSGEWLAADATVNLMTGEILSYATY